ncbi:hypothetical protein R3P38DRAFT_2532738, partial [Favolaschia claudopus]
GFTDIQLLQSNLPIPALMECRTNLLRTALAYYDEGRHLKSLVPIREYVQQNHPPSLVLITPLQDYIHSQLHFLKRYDGTDQMPEINKVLTANSGNIQSVLGYGLNSENPGIQNTIECTISFSRFERLIGHGWPALMDAVSPMLAKIKNPKLQVQFIAEEFTSALSHPVSNHQQLFDQAMLYLMDCDDQALASHFYQSAGWFYQYYQTNDILSTELFRKAFAAAQICGDMTLESNALQSIAQIDWKIGNYVMGQRHASEAHRLARLSGNLYQEGKGLWVDAMCTRDLGDHDVALKLLHRSRNCLARCGLAGGRTDAVVMNSLAELHLSKSEYSEAYQIHTNMVQDAVLAMNKHTYGYCLLNTAQIDVIIGTPANEVQLKIDELKGIFTTSEYATAQITEMVSAVLSLREGNEAHAGSTLTKYFHKFFGIAAELALYAIEKLAYGDSSKTFGWAVVYLSYAFKLKKKLTLHKALACIGQIYLAQHDRATAHNLLTVALDGFIQMGVHHDRARCLLYLGNIAEQEGNVGKATDLWTKARPLFEKCLQSKDVEKIDAQLAKLVEEKVTTKEECMHYSNSVPVEKTQSRLAMSLI